MEIPNEYLDGDFDFGFTAVDADDLGAALPQEKEEQQSSGISEEHYAALLDKMNLILASIPGDELYFPDIARVEGKVDNILNLQNDELAKTVASQGDNIRVVIEEVEERKKQLEDTYKTKMNEMEKLILPLLYNLMKNPDKEYILWPDRQESIEKQIRKIVSITREEV
tara:strand:+ start:762 stop:1265 length:504 start_codon:yes stop_codon:yes gene_type:complete